MYVHVFICLGIHQYLYVCLKTVAGDKQENALCKNICFKKFPLLWQSHFKDLLDCLKVEASLVNLQLL